MPAASAPWDNDIFALGQFPAVITGVVAGAGPFTGQWVYIWRELGYDSATGRYAVPGASLGGGTYASGYYVPNLRSGNGTSQPLFEINNLKLTVFPVVVKAALRTLIGGQGNESYDFDAGSALSGGAPITNPTLNSPALVNPTTSGTNTVVTSAPVTVTTSQNNYDPTAGSTIPWQSLVLLNVTSPSSLTGVLPVVVPPGNSALDLIIWNTGTAALTVPHKDAGSIPGNQFANLFAQALVIPPLGWAWWKGVAGSPFYWNFFTASSSPGLQGTGVSPTAPTKTGQPNVYSTATGLYAPGTVGVTSGGTGLTAATAYGVVAGGTSSSSPLQSVGVGTAGQVLTSNGAGALPSMQTPSGGSVTIGTTPVAGGTAGTILAQSATGATVAQVVPGGAGRPLVSQVLPSLPSYGMPSNVWGSTGLDTSGATNGQLLIGNGSGFALAALIQGPNISIINGVGTITISAPATTIAIGSTAITSGTAGAILYQSATGAVVAAGSSLTFSAVFGLSVNGNISCGSSSVTAFGYVLNPSLIGGFTTTLQPNGSMTSSVTWSVPWIDVSGGGVWSTNGSGVMTVTPFSSLAVTPANVSGTGTAARYSAGSGGTADTATNVAISGWGSGATISVLSGSTDIRGQITVTTSALGTPTLNPTITLTFVDGAWAAAPFPSVNQVATGSIAIPVSVTTTTTTLVITIMTTPPALTAQAYTFTYGNQG